MIQSNRSLWNEAKKARCHRKPTERKKERKKEKKKKGKSD